MKGYNNTGYWEESKAAFLYFLISPLGGVGGKRWGGDLYLQRGVVERKKKR